jgi:hypothetical protein
VDAAVSQFRLFELIRDCRDRLANRARLGNAFARALAFPLISQILNEVSYLHCRAAYHDPKRKVDFQREYRHRGLPFRLFPIRRCGKHNLEIKAPRHLTKALRPTSWCRARQRWCRRRRPSWTYPSWTYEIPCHALPYRRGQTPRWLKRQRKGRCKEREAFSFQDSLVSPAGGRL